MRRPAAVWQAALLLLTVTIGVPCPAASQPRPREGFATTSDGLRIHYVEAGDGPCLLFVPGWTMPAEIWEAQLTHFAAGWRVVAMDPRAQGKSTHTTDGLFPAARARDIKAVIDELGLAPVVIVGWSMGVTEIVSFVDQFGTEALAGLVFVDGTVGGEYDQQSTPQMVQFLASLQRNREEVTAEFVRSMFRTPRSDEYLQRITDAALKTSTTSAIALVVGAIGLDNRAALRKIDRPTLIIGTSGPLLASFQDMARRARARLEIFRNAGHALFVDETTRFNTLVEQFLRTIRHAR